MDAQPKNPSTDERSRAQILDQLSPQEWGRLRRQARGNSRNRSDVEDALQEGCVQFLRFYEGPASDALPWLLLVVKRCAWRIGRRARQREVPTHVVTTIDFEDASESEVVAMDERAGTEELAERAFALQARIELFAELKPDERTALILIGLGASYAEIGELRGWSHTKINRCVAEGRARLRQLDGGGER
jgi:RNA polymerase sigma factor (sigma-70 family)